MGFYDDMRADVSEKLLTKFGAEFTFTLAGNGGIDPYTGEATDSEPDVTYTVTGVFKDYTAFEKQNTAIQDGDIKMVCIGDDMPAIGSTVTTSRGTFRVQDAEDVAPDMTTSVVYKLQLRGI